jgi:hypothetical protein
MRACLRSSIDFRYVNIVFVDRAGRNGQRRFGDDSFASRSRSGHTDPSRGAFPNERKCIVGGTGQDSGEGMRVNCRAEF